MLTRNERWANVVVCPTCKPLSPTLLHAKELYLPLQFTIRRTLAASKWLSPVQWRISYKHGSGLEKVRDKPLPIQSGSVGNVKRGRIHLLAKQEARSGHAGRPEGEPVFMARHRRYSLPDVV